MSEPSFKAVSMPTGAGAPGAAMAAGAPIGAVKTKDRERYARTSLVRGDASTFTLVTGLPGTVLLQQKCSDGTWTTLSNRGCRPPAMPRAAGRSPRCASPSGS